MPTLLDMVKKLKEKKAPEPIPKPKKEKTIHITTDQETGLETSKKDTKIEINESLELNLIKSIYANRFGSTTNKTKAHMIRKIKNAWKY